MPPGNHLRIRLERQTPAKTQAGCAIAIGIFLIIAGAIPITLTIANDPPGERLFFYLWGGAFAAIGLLVLYSGIVQKLALKWPETIVESENEILRRGDAVQFYFQQPGPVSLISLRANLVGEERWATRRSRRNAASGLDHHTRHLGTFNFLDIGERDVSAEEPLELFASLEVPPDIPPSKGGGALEKSVFWKIEVWGKVKGGADFMHPFDVTVR